MKLLKKNGFINIKGKYKAESSVMRDIYLKIDDNPNLDPLRPRHRTLMVLNLPSYVNEETILRIFKAYGTIDDVYFCKEMGDLVTPKKNPDFFPSAEPITGIKIAYVVFSSSKSVTKSLLIDEPILFTTKTSYVSTGVNEWIGGYRDIILELVGLEQDIDDYLRKHDIRILEEEKKLKVSGEAPDDDGWVKVTKFSKNKGASRSEADDNRIKSKEKAKGEEKELLNFYKFQIRDTKKKNIDELRERFEQDKKRVAEMKSKRKFKPY